MMKIQTIKYWRGKERAWEIIDGSNPDPDAGIKLDWVNLIVGANASGKTNFINIIYVLTRLLTGGVKFKELQNSTFRYEVVFLNNADTCKYILYVQDYHLVFENLSINGNNVINGDNSSIFYEETSQYLRFSYTTDTPVAATNNIEQHGFLSPLQAWAKGVFMFNHGEIRGKDDVIIKGEINLDDYNYNFDQSHDLVNMYLAGTNDYPISLKKGILQDMSRLGYDITDILLTPVLENRTEFYGLGVNEVGLDITIDQLKMSQGMFRIFSLILQLNLIQCSNLTSLFLIDDIGEGLDFIRSGELMQLLLEKVEGSNIQLIMTTNDPIVMNAVPLKKWQVIKRNKSKVLFYNYSNSEAEFLNFELIGLNNFDFLKYDFIGQE